MSRLAPGDAERKRLMADETPLMRHFASDNYSGICPEAWQALGEANQGHVVSYGDDRYTWRAEQALRDFFETDCIPFFTFNGTAANALAVSAMCRSYQGVIAHEWSHMATDECAAPEFFSGGARVVTLPGDMGKLDPHVVSQRVIARPDIHATQLRALSVTQVTEVGTVYRVDELAQLADVARRHSLFFHMDGARFANAIAHLNVAPKEITWQTGVDVLSLGGTKNGLPVGDVILFFNRDLANEFAYRRKQAGQLASKMRFLTAPWSAVLASGAYLAHARHANAMAQLLREKLMAISGLRIVYPTEANSVFVDMDEGLREGLRSRGWKFYGLIGENICRLMASWDTTETDITRLCHDISEVSALEAAR